MEKRGLIIGIRKTQNWVEDIKRLNHELAMGNSGLVFDFLSDYFVISERNRLENDETVAQLIPYLIIRDMSSTDEPKYFAYQRKEGIGDNRLLNKRSIGFGGHMDLMDAMDVIDRISSSGKDNGILKAHHLEEIVCNAIHRELWEEVEFATPTITNVTELIPKALIYREDSDVDRVHLGIVYELSGMNASTKEPELEMIGSFTHSELMANQEFNEVWTNHIVENNFYNYK